MKKLIAVSALLCMMHVSAMAQIEKGAIFIGASSNFGYNNLSPDSSSGFTVMNLDLKGGYFIINNLAVGLNVGYVKIDEYSEMSFGGFARYYIAGKFFAGAGFTSISPEEGDSTTEIPVEIGYAAFITDNIAIEPGLSYVIGDGYEKFGPNVGFSLYLNR